MPKFVLSTLVLLVLSCGLSMANDCQIKEINPKEESNSFTLENMLAKDFSVFTEQPIKTLVNTMPIFIFKDKKHIGFQRIEESFYSQDTLEKSYKKWGASCQSDILKFTKNSYTVLLENTKPLSSDSLNTISIFVIPDKQKTKDYFYLLSFKGFNQQDVLQMVLKNK